MHGPTANTVPLLSRACMLRALPSNSHSLQSHSLATGLYATIFRQHDYSELQNIGMHVTLRDTTESVWMRRRYYEHFDSLYEEIRTLYSLGQVFTDHSNMSLLYQKENLVQGRVQRDLEVR
jgi:hypothetical protein